MKIEGGRLSSCGARLMSLSASDTVVCGGQTFVADPSKGYVKFTLAHSFPVRTTDGSALHPAVVAKCFGTMQHQVFNLAHIMRSYDPSKFPRDRMLGSVVAVEFPDAPKGGWKVQSDPDAAPGMLGASVIHKAAEGAPGILQSAAEGVKWMVSQEIEYSAGDSGLVLHGADAETIKAAGTPEDFAALGCAYWSLSDAPSNVSDCLEVKDGHARITGNCDGKMVTLLIGGLDGEVHFSGVGLTPLGKEPTAQVLQMAASDGEGALVAEFLERARVFFLQLCEFVTHP